MTSRACGYPWLAGAGNSNLQKCACRRACMACVCGVRPNNHQNARIRHEMHLDQANCKTSEQAEGGLRQKLKDWIRQVSEAELALNL